jgi:uncharacterized membrane protein YtjA (UPF0391 family)
MIVRSFTNQHSFLFYYSIHCFLIFVFLFYPSSLDSSFISFLRYCAGIQYSRSTSSSFLVNAQQQNLYLLVVAGTGTGFYNGDDQPATSAQLTLMVLVVILVVSLVMVHYRSMMVIIID